MPNYDRAITVFSPEGQLLQVQYASEAARKGSPVVGVRGADCVVIASEKKPLPFLFESRTEKKIFLLDGHVVMAYAGLKADARVLATRARLECQCHRLSIDDPVTVEYITRYVAQVKQLYTQSDGYRPFGVTCMIGGVDSTGEPRLYETEPSGIFYEWKAAATGRNEKIIREYLEQNYNAEQVATEEGALNLAMRAMLQCQPPESTNSFEVAVVKHNQPVCFLDEREVKALVSHLQKQNKTADKTKAEEKEVVKMSRKRKFQEEN